MVSTAIKLQTPNALQAKPLKTMYIKGLLWPPRDPKTESYFSPISADWFTRRITEM